MTDKEIKALAKELVFYLDQGNGWTEETFMAFARKCIETERNACAKICADIEREYTDREWDYSGDFANVAGQCLEQIMKRTDQPQ